MFDTLVGCYQHDQSNPVNTQSFTLIRLLLFLMAAMPPADLVHTAADLGLQGLALLDVDGMYSTIQVTMAARDSGLPIVYGSELTLDHKQFSPLFFRQIKRGGGLVAGAEDPGIRLPILATSPRGYTSLCASMSDHFLARPGRRKSAHLLEDLSEHSRDWIVMTGTARGPLKRAIAQGGVPAGEKMLDLLIGLFGRESVVVENCALPTDSRVESDRLADLAHRRGLRLVATTGARCATPNSQALGDVLCATRLNRTLERAEPHLPAFRTFLRSASEMVQIHRHHLDDVANACDIARQAAFDLRLVAPHLPRTHVPSGHTPASWLRELTYRGARRRYGSASDNPQAWRTIERELDIIADLDFPGYFLIVNEIIDFCRSKGILAQGRGSAANSAVCFVWDHCRGRGSPPASF